MCVSRVGRCADRSAHVSGKARNANARLLVEQVERLKVFAVSLRTVPLRKHMKCIGAPEVALTLKWVYDAHVAVIVLTVSFVREERLIWNCYILQLVIVLGHSTK